MISQLHSEGCGRSHDLFQCYIPRSVLREWGNPLTALVRKTGFQGEIWNTDLLNTKLKY